MLKIDKLFAKKLFYGYHCDSLKLIYSNGEKCDSFIWADPCHMFKIVIFCNFLKTSNSITVACPTFPIRVQFVFLVFKYFNFYKETCQSEFRKRTKLISPITLQNGWQKIILLKKWRHVTSRQLCLITR